MNRYGLKKKKHRCHSKVTPIISMDGINGHKKAIFVYKEKNPRLIYVTGKGLIVTEMTDIPSFGVFQLKNRDFSLWDGVN